MMTWRPMKAAVGKRIWYLSHKTHNVKRVLKFKVGPERDHQQQRYTVTTSIATGDCLMG
jgi:hypothetical protein